MGCMFGASSRHIFSAHVTDAHDDVMIIDSLFQVYGYKVKVARDWEHPTMKIKKSFSKISAKFVKWQYQRCILEYLSFL